MNIPDSAEEPSSKRQENGDASTGSERPLKKARYAWQVKGRYHLKSETNDSTRAPTALSSNSDDPGTSSENNDKSTDLVGNPEQNLEILGDYLLKQDFNSLDSVIADTDKSLLTPSTRISTQQLQYPRYVSSYDNNRSNETSILKNDSSDQVAISVSMVEPHNYNEDQCIARWQARQMAKGFVDNTINRVLDSWSHPPLPPDMDNSRIFALDAAEFINNLPGDNSIENEGILMAISAHGLQNTSKSSSSDLNTEEPQIHSDAKYFDTFLSSPSSPIQLDEDPQNKELNNNKQDSERVSSSDSSSYSDDNVKKDNNLTPFSYFPDSSNSYQYFSDDHLHATNMEFDSEENFSGNHFDFMDAAVSFAIQNKGLTTFGTDYG